MDSFGKTINSVNSSLQRKKKERKLKPKKIKEKKKKV